MLHGLFGDPAATPIVFVAFFGSLLALMARPWFFGVIWSSAVFLSAKRTLPAIRTSIYSTCSPATWSPPADVYGIAVRCSTCSDVELAVAAPGAGLAGRSPACATRLSNSWWRPCPVSSSG